MAIIKDRRSGDTAERCIRHITDSTGSSPQYQSERLQDDVAPFPHEEVEALVTEGAAGRNSTLY
jgi:hypothetical protein